MTKPEFLPENPYPYKPLEICSEHNTYKEGSEDTLKSLAKWLFLPCTEHFRFGDTMKPVKVYPEHRYRCSDCMQQLKQEREK